MQARLIAAAVTMAVSGMGLTGSPAWAQLGGDAPATQPAHDQPALPVKSVVLFSSGVGYFEHIGLVRGTGSTELRFKGGQINDILKSLVMEDLGPSGAGRVSVITYPSVDPLAKTLRSFQIDITGNPSMADLLNQLRGAKVTLSIAGEMITGTVLGVEKKQRPVGDKQVMDIWVLNLINNGGGGIRAITLDDVRDVHLDDATLQGELNRALAALAQARDQDKKPVTIGYRGEGERPIRIGYVVETPVWKTSYRLILGPEAAPPTGTPPASQPAGSGNLQGWAIVENQTDNDWDGVQLSLVSGRPISFVEDLYRPLYIPRPVVQPQLYASLRPQTYESGMEEAKAAQPFQQQQQAAAGRGRAGGGGGGGGFGGGGGAGGGGRGGAPAFRAAAADASADTLSNSEVSDQPIDPTKSVASIASASKVGELFEYTIRDRVNLPRQTSAMIPIVTDPVEVERLSIYNPNVLPRNPLTGARVKNTTGKHLLAGPITVLDAGTYAGDAQIDNLPPGQERLLSYGIDLQVLVDSTKNTQRTLTQTGKLVQGVLQLTLKEVATRDYDAQNKSDHNKTMIIEHSFRQGWKLVDTQKPIESTDQLYRFKGGIKAGERTLLTVKEEMVHMQEIAILPMDADSIEVYCRAGEIPKEVRDAMTKAATMKRALATLDQQIADHKQKIADITAEQGRIRENMRTVQQNSQYYNRLITKLNDQETQLEKLQIETDDLQKKMDGQRAELNAYLAGLNVG